jgi:hypothetical protein
VRQRTGLLCPSVPEIPSPLLSNLGLTVVLGFICNSIRLADVVFWVVLVLRPLEFDTLKDHCGGGNDGMADVLV